MKITQEILLERFEYVPTGHFRRRKTGHVLLGTVSRTGRVYLSFRLGKTYTVQYHRLIFLYHHGYLPKELDHINHVFTDNRIENLQPSNRIHNNARKRPYNKAGLPKGVYPQGQKFCAMLTINKKLVYLGYFKTVEEAADAVKKLHLATYGDIS